MWNDPRSRRRLEARIRQLERENKAYLENLSAVQTRCTELINESRALKIEFAAQKSGLTLPGWTCASCQGFNGSAKEERTECRGCGAARTP